MSTYETISVSIASIALIVSVIAIFRSATANKFAKEANLLASGQIEMVAEKRVSETREKIDEIAMKISPLSAKTRTPEEEIFFQDLRSFLRSAMENHLNAYEGICGLYLDGKIDQERFHKNYKSAIRNLLQEKTYKDFLDSRASKFHAILTVYEKWENLEK